MGSRLTELIRNAQTQGDSADGARSRELQQAHRDLMSAYREAIRAAEREDPFTKASVTRTVIDSGRALAGRLRTREEGVDDLAESLEKYTAALRPEDWVEKVGPVTKSVTKIAGLMGLTS